MSNLSLKQKIMIAVAAVGAILILIFQQGLYSKTAPKTAQPDSSSSESSEPKIISTSPSPLEGAIILPNQSLQIVFSLPLENVGEFKHRLTPDTPYETKLSDDKKTITIFPISPFTLGAEYTLYIDPESKFQGGKKLNGGQTIHFRTIDYKGV